MISSRHLLISILTSLVLTEPIHALSINRFRSAYATIRTDIRSLFSRKKIDDPEQKKRITIEIAGAIAIMLITGSVIWLWWVRPLQKELHAHDERSNNSAFSLDQIHIDFSDSDKNEDDLMQIINSHDRTTLQKPDSQGSTILHYAASRDLPRVITKLLAKELDIDRKNILGETPLHFAAFHNQQEIVKLLLDNHADPTIMNNDRLKPFELTHDSEIQRILGEAENRWAKRQESDPPI